MFFKVWTVSQMPGKTLSSWNEKAWELLLHHLAGLRKLPWYVVHAKAHAWRVYWIPVDTINPTRERICLLPVSVNFPDSARNNESNALFEYVYECPYRSGPARPFLEHRCKISKYSWNGQEFYKKNGKSVLLIVKKVPERDILFPFSCHICGLLK